jgi:hypothetical protein
MGRYGLSFLSETTRNDTLTIVFSEYDLFKFQTKENRNNEVVCYDGLYL